MVNCPITVCQERPAVVVFCALDAPFIDGAPPRLCNRSLVIASLELGRVLADRGKVSFRAQGTCMFPCIQPGDKLHIQSRTIEQVQVGDIAVFRRGNILLGHRTINKSAHDGKTFIITCPDRTKQGDDGPSFAADVLGVVTAIERHGVRMPLHPHPVSGLGALSVGILEWWNLKARPLLIERLVALQCHSWYRPLALAWFSLVQARLSFVVRIPLTATQPHDLFREVSPEKFDISQPSWQGKAVMRWLLLLYVNGAQPPAASATINWYPEDCLLGAGWRIDEMQVRVRYRGMGLDDALIRQVQAILRRAG